MRGWKGGLRKGVAGDKQKAGSAFHCIPAFLISLLSVGFLLFCGKEFFGQFFHLQEVGFLHAAFNRDHVFHDFHVFHFRQHARHHASGGRCPRAVFDDAHPAFLEILDLQMVQEVEQRGEYPCIV